MHAFGKIVLGATVFAAQSRAGNILAGDGANGAVVLPPHASSALNINTAVQVSRTSTSLSNLQSNNLIAQVINTLHTHCPDVPTPAAYTQCDTNPPSIDDVATIDGPNHNLGGGTLIFTINEGNYTSNAQRDGMLSLFANTLHGAATGSNCQVENFRSDCPLRKKERKIKGRSPIGTGNRPPVSEGSDCEHSTMTMCSGPNNVAIQILENNQVTASMNINLNFVDPNVPFNCNGALAAIGASLAIFPMFGDAAEALSLAVGATQVICNGLG